MISPLMYGSSALYLNGMSGSVGFKGDADSVDSIVRAEHGFATVDARTSSDRIATFAAEDIVKRRM